MHAHDAETHTRRTAGAGFQRRARSGADPRAPLSAAGLTALQRAAGNRAVASVVQRDEDEVAAGEQVRSVLGSGGGAPLESSFRARAESFLGTDLSAVRVHTGTAAAESAAVVQSHAYTSGSDIVFGRGMYDTSSPAGQGRLAHELTHVVQQRQGPVAGTTSAGGLSISDPSDRFEREAEQMGAAFVSAGADVQRQVGDEDELQE